MSLSLKRADFFVRDFKLQAAWYVEKAGEEIAERYLQALEATLDRLCLQPGSGRLRRFHHPKLKGLHSFRVSPPFDRHLVFYRFDHSALYAERVIHGMRDLPRRLLQVPEQDTA